MTETKDDLHEIIHQVKELHYPKWIKGREVCAHCRKTATGRMRHDVYAIRLRRV